MKKIFLGIMLVVFSVSAYSQSFTRVDGQRGLVVYKLEAWSAFTSDSLSAVSTNPVDVSMLDTLYIWGYCTSANGTPKYVAALQGGFTTGTSSAVWDSLGIAADSTNIKLETLKYLNCLSLKGAPTVRVKIHQSIGGTGAGIANRKDGKVYFYLIGKERGLAQIPN